MGHKKSKQRNGPKREGPETRSLPRAAIFLAALGFLGGVVLAVIVLRESPGGDASEVNRHPPIKPGTVQLSPELDRDLAKAKEILRQGEELEARGERDRAERAYLQAAKLVPWSPEPYYHLGLVAEAKGQYEVATNQFRRALEADPTHAPSAHYLAIQLRRSGKFLEAEKLLLDALSRAPANLSLRLNLAHTYLREGDAKNASRQFQLAIGAGCQMAEAHYFLGCALELLGREKEAVDALREALERDPHLAMAWYALAQLQKRRGEQEDAARAFREFEKARALKEQKKKSQKQ